MEEVWEEIGEDARSSGGAAAAVTSLLLRPPPPSSSESCREPQPKQAAAAAAGTARRPSLDRAAVSLQRSKTRDGASALCSPGRRREAPAWVSLPLPARSTFRAEPAPRPPLSTPRPCRRGARAGPLLQRSGSAPAWPPEPGALRLPCPRHPGRPPARRNPRGGRAGVFGWLPESRRGVWENGRGRSGEDAGVREGAVRGGVHCGCRAPRGWGRWGGGDTGDLLALSPNR